MEPCRLGIGEEVDDIIELKVRALDVEGYFVGLDESMLPTLLWSLMTRTVTVAIFEDGEIADSSITRTSVTMLRPLHFGDLYFGIHYL